MRAEIREKLRNLVRRNYEEISENFNLTRKKEIWPEIRQVADKIKDGDKILDLGCGNGRLLEAVKDKKIKYLGLDASESLIKKARLNYPGYEFLVQDILDLKLEKLEKYNYIFCLAVLQHIPSRELRVEVLKKMKEILVPGGEIIISNWNLWQSKKHLPLIIKNYFIKIFGQSKLDFGDLIFSWKNSQGEEISQRYYHAFTKNELRRLIRKTGLRTKKIYSDNYNYWLILE